MAGGNAEWGSHSGKLNVQLPYEQESPPRNLPKGEKKHNLCSFTNLSTRSVYHGFICNHGSNGKNPDVLQWMMGK